MYHLSESSMRRLAPCHNELRRLACEAIQTSPVDFAVICGLRTEEDQNKAFEEGHSSLRWPHSRHNRSTRPDGTFDYRRCDAMDIVPYPVEWPDKKADSADEYARKLKRFVDVAAHILSTAKRLGIPIRWGGQFPTLFDPAHYERMAP